MSSLSRTVLVYLIATALCAVALVFELRLWRADLHVPFYYEIESDGPANMGGEKAIIDTGWIFTDPWLAAPGIGEYYDFTQSDSLPALCFKLCALVASDLGTAINYFYIFQYALTTWAGLFVLRRFGISDPIAIAASLLYAFQCYHFAHGAIQLNLPFYAPLPLIVMVILWLCEGRPVFAAWDGSKRTHLRSSWGNALTAVVACVLVGSWHVYFAFFACALVVVAALIAFLRAPKPARLVDPLITIALICLVVVVNFMPRVWYTHTHGSNSVVLDRPASQSAVWGLSVTEMLSTVPYHQLKTLWAAVLGKERSVPSGNTFYEQSFPSYRSALGMVGSCGFLVLIGALFLSRRPRGDLELIGPLSKLNIAAVLLGTLQGFGYIFALRVTPVIRYWNRLSIFIAFFSLMAVAILWEHAGRHWIKTAAARLVFQCALGGMLVFGLIDQMSSAMVPDYEKSKMEYIRDQKFVRKIEAELPPGAMVFQLPYAPFPEGHSAHNAVPWTFWSYTHFRPYLHSHHIHWSAGAMKGREVAKWQSRVAEEPPRKMVEELTRSGFRGVYIDRGGYDDGADVKIIAGLREVLGVEPIVDGANRLFFALPAASGSALESHGDPPAGRSKSGELPEPPAR
jgi:phosphoglycerol transferase